MVQKKTTTKKAAPKKAPVKKVAVKSPAAPKRMAAPMPVKKAKPRRKAPCRNILEMLVGIGSIALGVYVWFNPSVALLGLAVYLGVIFGVIGVAQLMAFATRPYARPWHMAFGLLNVIVGVLLLSNIGITMVILPNVLAFWAIATGAMQLAVGVQEYNLGVPAWGWQVASGLLGVLFGLMIFYYPMVGILTISLLIGAYFFIYGTFAVAQYLSDK